MRAQQTRNHDEGQAAKPGGLAAPEHLAATTSPPRSRRRVAGLGEPVRFDGLAAPLVHPGVLDVPGRTPTVLA